MSNYRFSVYRNTKDTRGIVVPFESIQRRILSGAKGLAENTKQAEILSVSDKARYKEFKEKHFPAVTFGGTFSYRNTASLVEHSGLLVLDFDNVDIGVAMYELVIRPETLFCFRSPSGTGVKPVVKVRPTPQNAKDHADAWKYAAAAFADIGKADESGIDIARLCFLAHDPQAYTNLNSVPIEWESIPTPTPKPYTKTHSGISDRDLKILEHFSGERYEDWLAVGMALHSSNGTLEQWVKWSATQPKYVVGECAEKWESFGKKAETEERPYIHWGSIVWRVRQKLMNETPMTQLRREILGNTQRGVQA